MPYSLLDCQSRETDGFNPWDEYLTPEQYATADDIRVLRAIGVEPMPARPEWDYDRTPRSEVPDDIEAILAEREEM